MDTVKLVSVAALVSAATLAYTAVRLALTDCDLTLAAATPEKIPSMFKSKRIWITGGSSGIGKTLAIKLGKIQGTHILISSRSQQALDDVKKEIESTGGRCSVLVVDLADLQSLKGKAEEAKRILGGDVDVLINNGGVSQRSMGVETNLDTDTHLMNVDFLSATVLTKALVAIWLSRPDKTEPKGVINISSLAGKAGIPLRTFYCASKFALIGFMDSLRSETGVDGNIIFSNICPGSVQTNVSRNAMTATGEKFGVTDVNIANGMAVERCADLILRAYANELPEVWMFGNRNEKLLAYLAQYAPAITKTIMKKQGATMVKQYMEMVLAAKKGQ